MAGEIFAELPDGERKDATTFRSIRPAGGFDNGDDSSVTFSYLDRPDRGINHDRVHLRAP